MVILFAATALIVVVSFYFVLDRFDRFVQQGGFVDGPSKPYPKVVLIFDDHNNIEVSPPFPDPVSIPFVSIAEPTVPENVTPVAVLALSSNDLNNVLLCNEAAHYYQNILLIAVCNNSRHRFLYEQASVDHIFSTRPDSDTILQLIEE